MTVELLILVLIGFMLVAGLIAVETRDLLSSIICVGAAGFALSVIDLLVGAPDLAITQVVVEVVALVLLIRVVLTRKDTSIPTHSDTLRTGLTLLGGGVVLVVVFLVVGGFGGQGTIPPFGAGLLTQGKGVGLEYLCKSSAETGAANSVMGVLLDYRAYDTLGEATVIFVSIVGAYAVLRAVGRRKEGE